MTARDAKVIIEKLQNGTIAPAERQLLLHWLHQTKHAQATDLTDAELQACTQEAKHAIDASLSRGSSSRLVRSELSRPSFWAAAAIFLVALAGLGAYIFQNTGVDKINISQEFSAAHDIAPGKPEATITLSDGSEILLSEIGRGIIGHEGNVTIQKTADGTVSYVSREGLLHHSGGGSNTINVPRGAEYQVILPDGTRVWLNAASKLTYPTQFSGATREVTLEGEGYFEVAHRATQPFFVHTHAQTIEVLGTHFNVRSYDTHEVVTSLFEGAINVAHPTIPAHKSAVAPGEQVTTSTRQKQAIFKLQMEDPEQVIAWKNGKFIFNGQTIASVMEDISRWYDISVSYPNGVPNTRIGGRVERNKNLSDILKTLSAASGHQFKLQGKEVIVEK